MPTDASGTPTPLGIPKYNVDADAPSGLGFNATMDVIDTLLAARITKPSGILSGEGVVWNGSGWDRSTVTKLGLASISIGGTPNGSKFLRDDGTWAALPGGTVAKGVATVSIANGANTGTATVTHGLGGTPTAVLLSPNQALEAVAFGGGNVMLHHYADTYGSTTFRIVIQLVGGATTNGAYGPFAISWAAI